MISKDRIKLLPHWCITETSPAFYDAESKTAVGQTARLYGAMRELQEDYNKYVNEINATITAFINDVNADQEEFINSINKIMHDYIAMIDEKIKMQDEVIDENITYIRENMIESLQEVLNQMVESGQLDAIILNTFNELNDRVQTLEKTKTVKTIDEMKVITNLTPGTIVNTIGYYYANDGGGATYLIREKSGEDIEDNGAIHFINDSLVAELIKTEPGVYVEQFGARGDGATDDTQAFRNAINYSETINLYKKTYKLTKLTIAKNLIINGNDATLKDSTAQEHFIEMTTNTQNLTLKAFKLNVDCPNSNVGIYINKNRLIADQILVKNAVEINIHILKTESWGNCHLKNVQCQLSKVGIQLNATDCFISDYVGYNCMTHLMNRGGITHLNKFHGWNFNTADKDWISGSTLIDTTADIVGNDIYIDTLENGITLPNGYQYTAIILQNVSYFLNLSSYPKTQKHPTLLNNVENFNGWCKIDGFFGNENGWSDTEGNYPTLIDDIDTARISITNVGNSGFRFGKYKPFVSRGEIPTTAYTIEDNTYLSVHTRKYKCDKYGIKINMWASLKTKLTTNTLILKMNFANSPTFSVLDGTAIIDAKFCSTEVVGKSYKLDAHISGNNLYVYNNTGKDLNNGSVVINIDYDNLSK